MRRIDRKDLRAPARVLDLELGPDGAGEDDLTVERYSTVWCLSRLDGVPREVSFWDVAADSCLSVRDLRDQLRSRMAAGDWAAQQSRLAAAARPDLTVVIPTRDRPAGLSAALASLRRQTDRDFGVVVVDNAPGSPGPTAAVADMRLPRCEYVAEPRPGASRARNRGLDAVHTELVAFMDDDEVADPDWVRRLEEGFAHHEKPAAVCGVMLPAELEFEAQVRFEQYGGFNKGRGMVPDVLRAGAPSVISPLYPLPGFGAGGNMAFRTESLRAAGGFDPCLGAGTRVHGCEETRVLSSLLSVGQAVLHWPAAITWHTHRREMDALRRQLYGYSAGLSGFYASTIRSRPAAVFDILRLAPHMVRDLGRGGESLRSGGLPDDFPPSLLRAARRGLLEGGFMYACEAARDRRRSYRRPGKVVRGASHA
jgi:glycosyltransferase involved in cell wall biosynthesis